MTEPTPPARIRIGSAERHAALIALGAHMDAGRLDPDEYGERVAKASVARYTSDLAALFADLPTGPSGDLVPIAPESAKRNSTQPVFTDRTGRQPMFGRAGFVAVSISPFIALALFFSLAAAGVALAWLSFLLIPVAGAVIYGGGHSERQ